MGGVGAGGARRRRDGLVRPLSVLRRRRGDLGRGLRLGLRRCGAAAERKETGARECGRHPGESRHVTTSLLAGPACASRGRWDPDDGDAAGLAEGRVYASSGAAVPLGHMPAQRVLEGVAAVAQPGVVERDQPVEEPVVMVSQSGQPIGRR